MSKTNNNIINNLPEGWNHKKLGEASKIISGFAFSSKDFSSNHHTKCIKITNVGVDHFIETVDGLLPKQFELKYKNFQIRTGEIVISLTRPLINNGLKVCKVPSSFNGALVNQRVAALKEISNVSFTQFLYYFLKTSRVSDYVEEKSRTMNQPNLSIKDLFALQIPLPPLPEQQRIVQKLDALFERLNKAIALTKENLEHCRHLLPAALNEVFGEAKTVSLQKLNDIALVARGKSKHRPRNDKKLFGGKYPFIQTGDVRSATKYITEYEQTYSEIGLAQSKLWPRGTICMTIAANIGDVAILGIDACFPDSIVGIQVNKKCDSEYLYYYLQTLQAMLDKKSNAAAQKNINLNILEGVEVPIPDLDTQKNIVTYLNKLSQQQQQLQQHYRQQLQQLEQLKSSMLDAAFKGEL